MPFEAKDLKVGQKLKFENEKYYYQVRSVRHPFVICTLSLFGENYYSILDVDKGVRGAGTNPELSHFTDLEVEESMNALHGVHFEKKQSIAKRNQVPIVIIDVVQSKD